MIKKLFLLTVIASQLTISCSSDNEPVVTNASLDAQIAAVINSPYSNLTTSQQKVKLEAEANAMLVQMDKSKTSGAIEAMQNLGNLLSINSIDIFGGKNDNQIADILNVSGVYGIYTWNNSNQIWVKTISTTELKFVFPAKKSQTLNNASLSSKSTSSDIKVKLEDTYGNWVYNQNTGQSTQTPSINDEFFLPNSVEAILTIDSAQAASIISSAKYSNGSEAPDESSFKIILNDGYTFEISGKKATANEAKSSFSFNGKNILEFIAGSTANINGLLKEDNITSYGKANGLVRIMDNFIIVAEMDLTGLSTDEDALYKTLLYPDYNSSTYYADLNAYYKKESDGLVAAYNKNVKLVLVSKKDGTKIADLTQRSEKGDNYGSVQYYDSSLYLHFNDNTEVEFSTYFSSGFEDFQTKFENFLKAFDK